MAGHSKWKNIQRTKGNVDAKRRQSFTKVAKEITTIVQLTKVGDPSQNGLLQGVLERAKSLNMTKEKIQNAINRGLGIKDDTERFFEKTYEFYGPQSSQILVDCETDNPNRTIAEMKAIANKNNLKVANEGSISWQFRELGEIKVKIIGGEVESIIIHILELEGVEDVLTDNNMVTILIDRNQITNIRDFLNSLQEVEIVQIEILKKTSDCIKINDVKELREIEEEFFNNNSVVNIWKNYNEEE